MPDNEDARTWFNCVEEMVFMDDDFNSDLTYRSSDKMAMQRRKIQAVQAAYIVCLYQNWEGTDASKSRVRRYRFATLVSVSVPPSLCPTSLLMYRRRLVILALQRRDI
jgi:hypothetical protein